MNFRIRSFSLTDVGAVKQIGPEATCLLPARGVMGEGRVGGRGEGEQNREQEEEEEDRASSTLAIRQERQR